MEVVRRGMEYAVRVYRGERVNRHLPSVDVLFSSCAQHLGKNAVGVLLTGMGADGLLGMQAIVREGGLTVGQDEASCTVYGMPRSCAEAGGVLQRVVPLMQIPDQILQATHYRSHVSV